MKNLPKKPWRTLLWLLSIAGCTYPTHVTLPAPVVTIQSRTCDIRAVPHTPIMTAPVTEDTLAEIARFDKAVTLWMAQVAECVGK